MKIYGQITQHLSPLNPVRIQLGIGGQPQQSAAAKGGEVETVWIVEEAE